MSPLTTVYLAARYARRLEMLKYKADIDSLRDDAGVKLAVNTHWLKGTHDEDAFTFDRGPINLNTTAGVRPDELVGRARSFSRDDLTDIDAADVVICFTEDAREVPSTGGRHVEFGYALAQGKKIIIVGDVENIFYALAGRGTLAPAFADGSGAQLVRVKDWIEARRWLLVWAREVGE